MFRSGRRYLYDCDHAAKAAYLVTANIKDFPAAWQGVQIVTPRRMLGDLSAGQTRNS
jgi:hypothetical protein